MSSFDVLRLRLLKVLRRERRRQRSRKRGWGRVVSMGDDVPEVADPDGGRAVEEIDAREWIEGILGRLDGHDPSLRALMQQRINGRTEAEIAADWGVSIRTIERKMYRIRSILGPDLEDDG